MSAPAAPTLNGATAPQTDKVSSDPGIFGPVKRYLSRFDDGELVRWVFRGVLIGSIGVLVMDLKELSEQTVASTVETPETSMPVLPPAFQTGKPLPADPRQFVTGDTDELRKPMHFALGRDGVLVAEGAIDAGSADRLATELDARGEYVRTLSLNSPGGALQDAIAMARLVRKRKLDTEIADGALCASSCPLIFAGGTKRLAGREAAIGVHQFFTTASGDTPKQSDPAQALSDAQITTARISRHLADMGVDPALWLHALDTPPQALYYLSPDELTGYRLATGEPKPRPEASSPPPLRTKPAI